MSTEKTIILKKKNVVTEILTRIEGSEIVVVADYRGVTADDITQLRKEIRDNGGQATIYKNTLLRRAFADAKLEIPEDVTAGPSFVVTTKEDIAKLCKILVKFSKDTELFQIKGGVLDQSAITQETVKELAMLPGRDELIAKAVGLIKSPLTALVGNLSSPLRGLTLVLKAIQNQKQQEVK